MLTIEPRTRLLALLAVLPVWTGCATTIGPSHPRPAAPVLRFQEPAVSEDRGGEGEGPSFFQFTLRGGAQAVSKFGTTLRLDSAALGRGTSLRLEDDLGFDEKTEFARFDGVWRIDRDHAVELSYFGFDRTASRHIDWSFQWGDRVIGDSDIFANFSSDIVKAAYRYTFLSGEDWELGGAIGAHVMRLKTGIGTSRLGSKEAFDVALPMPVLGLRGTWEPWDRVRFTGLVDLFYVKLSNVGAVDDVEGFLGDLLVTAEYDLLDNLGLGVGVNYFQLNASAGGDLLRLSAEYDYLGGMLFAQFRF